MHRRPLIAAGALAVAVAAVGCGADATSGSTDRPPATASTATVPPSPPARPVLCRADMPKELGRVQDPDMDELSGLVRGRRTRTALFAIEDSGGAPVITTLATNGALLGKLSLDGAANVDWEDVAAAPGRGGVPSLFAADIGDNDARRDSVQIYRIPEPASAATTARVAAARLDLRYPDGPHDAEALIADPVRRELLIVTKGFSGGRVYTTSAAAPGGGAERTLRRGPSVPIGPVTAGDISADGRIVALRTYDELIVWRRNGREPLARTLARTPSCVAPAALFTEGQGEALALARDGRTVITAPEGRAAILRRYG